MAYEEVAGGSGSGNFEDREFVSAKIGALFEGIFQGMSKRLPSQFNNGEYRIVSLDLTDGRKVSVPSSKILLERIEEANLSQGDRVKIVVESATSKAGRQYALPRLYVDRGHIQPDPGPPAPAKPELDNPPF